MAVSRSKTPWNEDTFAASAGQVTFILTSAPTDSESTSVHVNGVEYNRPSDYTVSGATVTWLNTGFSLEVGDVLVAQYK